MFFLIVNGALFALREKTGKDLQAEIMRCVHLFLILTEGFLVLSGDDGMTLDLMRRGGEGVISVAANVFPKRFMQCVGHAKQGDFDRAE